MQVKEGSHAIINRKDQEKMLKLNLCRVKKLICPN